MSEFSKRIAEGVAEYQQCQIDEEEARNRELAEAAERARQNGLEIAQVLRENNCPTDQLWQRDGDAIRCVGEGWTLDEEIDSFESGGSMLGNTLGVTCEGVPFSYEYSDKDCLDVNKKVVPSSSVFIHYIEDPIRADRRLQFDAVEEVVIHRITNGTCRSIGRFYYDH